MTEKLQEGCTVQPQRIEELAEIIYNTCLEKGWDCDLNFIDTSKITNMCCLFADSDIKEDLDYIASIMNIKKYDLSKFNGDISKWNTSNVTDMSNMFQGTINFNSDISAWNTSNVKYMEKMFRAAHSFNQPIENWDVSNVTDMSYIFCNASSFNQPINNWNVSNVEDMEGMFQGAKSFNQPLNNWNVSSVENMDVMFWGAKNFNQPLNNWNVSNVKSMSWMFKEADNFKSDLPEFKNFRGTKEELLDDLCLSPDFKTEIKKNQEEKMVHKKGMRR